VVRVAGETASASSPRATIHRSGKTVRIFPSDTEYDATTDLYQNPIENGSVVIKVKTPYYEGWATYARQRTTANVTVYDANETVRLVLESLSGSPGHFPVPQEGDSLTVSGLGDGHPISEFTLDLSFEKLKGNTHWSLKGNDGRDEFEMHIHTQGKCNGGSYNEDDIHFSLYYYNHTNDEVREWQNYITPGPERAFEVDCDTNTLLVNFTDTNSNLLFEDIDVSGSNNKWCYGEHIDERQNPPSFTMDHHTEDGETTFYTNEEEGTHSASMNFTVNHYMSRMGSDYELTVISGPGNSECLSTGEGEGSDPIDERGSTGLLDYADSDAAKYLKYLHITENRIEVDLN
jgi:hypothetical protein